MDRLRSDSLTASSATPGVARNGLRPAVLIALLLLTTACATTDATRQTVGERCTPEREAKGECVGEGGIEITQDIGVDPQIKAEFNRAVALLAREEYPEAIQLLRAVTGKTTKFTAPFINLGIAYARTGEMDKAEENLQKALEINAKHPVAHNELGIVYRKTGRYEKARQHYESTLNMYPEFLPARKNLGVLCDIYLQDLNCAMKQYQAYLERRPDDEKVQIWVADLENRM